MDNRQIWMYPSDNRMKGRNERDFFIYFYDAMCSAKGNGLDWIRQTESTEKSTTKPGKKEKENYSAPHQTDLTDPLADRSDKETNKTKTKRNKMLFFFSFPAVRFVTATRYSRNQSIHSLSSLIRIRILLEGAASAICALSNKTHIWKGFLLGFYPLSVLFVFSKLQR